MTMEADDKGGQPPGLDKDARLARRREARKEERKIVPLNPPFPYRVVPFDPKWIVR